MYKIGDNSKFNDPIGIGAVIEKELNDRIKLKCKKEGINKSALVRMLLILWVDDKFKRGK